MYERLVETIVEAGDRWRDSSYAPREQAIDYTLAADNRFTEESVTFAVNQFAHQLTRGNIERWFVRAAAASRQRVGVAHGARVPTEGLRELLAVLLAGHEYLGRVPSASPALVPAFVRELDNDISERVRLSFDTWEKVVEQASAVLVSGDEEMIDTVVRACDKHNLSPDRRLVRTAQYAVAVVDGEEDEEARSGLAEDMLLFEGESPCNVGLLWAPENHTPDPYLEMLPQFREVFPPHEETDGSLAMPRAFLEAHDQGHAYGIGFLISRGTPELQRGAHVRWTEYDGYEVVNAYIGDHRDKISLIVAAPRVAEHLETDLSIAAPGGAHRRPLDWDSHRPETAEWLCNL